MNTAHLTQVQHRIEQVMQQLLSARAINDPQLLDAMRYSLLLGGKRIRPYLVYQVGTMLSALPEDLDGPAAAIECLHSYSLIHDDLPAMDNDDLRRGKPTCHKAFNEAVAILAGDALQTLAFEAIALHRYRQVLPAQVLTMVQQLALASGYNGMCGGQAVDLAHTNKSMSVESLESMHLLKTGALIECAVHLGWLASPKRDPNELAALLHYARAIGLAFQVQDDILDVEGDTATLGKPQGSDQQSNKATYPALLGMEQAKAKAQQLYREATNALAQLPYDTEELSQLAHYIVHRSF